MTILIQYRDFKIFGVKGYYRFESRSGASVSANHWKTHIIKDWTGKRCFGEVSFQTFQDGWEFLYTQFPGDDLKDPDEQDLQEYYVELK